MRDGGAAAYCPNGRAEIPDEDVFACGCLARDVSWIADGPAAFRYVPRLEHGWAICPTHGRRLA
jgi:hypothetical protein